MTVRSVSSAMIFTKADWFFRQLDGDHSRGDYRAGVRPSSSTGPFRNRPVDVGPLVSNNGDEPRPKNSFRLMSFDDQLE